MPAVVQSFRELNVDRLSREAAREIFRVSRSLPVEERYSLADQMPHSSRAVNAMIAEAWARRRYRAAFINKLDEALGEARETQAWLDHALDCASITADQHRTHDAAWQSVGAMLAATMNRAADFCKPRP